MLLVTDILATDDSKNAIVLGLVCQPISTSYLFCHLLLVIYFATKCTLLWSCWQRPSQVKLTEKEGGEPKPAFHHSSLQADTWYPLRAHCLPGSIWCNPFDFTITIDRPLNSLNSDACGLANGGLGV